MRLTLEVQADYFLNGFSVKTIVLVGIYNQQFKGTDFFLWSLTSRVKLITPLKPPLLVKPPLLEHPSSTDEDANPWALAYW